MGTGNLDDTFTIEQSVINHGEIDGFAQELVDLSHNNDAETMNGKRHNKDTTVNNNGNLLIHFSKVSNMKIVNGRFGSDKGKGELTLKKPHGKSTIDYCIVSPDLAPSMQNFEVYLYNPGLSDFHSPIILTLNANHNVPKEKELTPESDINYDPVSTRWCNEKKSVFQSKYDLSKIEEASQLLDTYETSIPNQNKFDEMVKKISDFPLFAGMDAGMYKRLTKNQNAPRPKKQYMPWFDHDCHMRKKSFSRSKNRYKRRQN